MLIPEGYAFKAAFKIAFKLFKNVLHFLLISAHNQIQSNWISRCNYFLNTFHDVGVY